MLLVVIIFVLILGILVFVHELGHFLMARKSGIQVQEFGFGLPPRIAGIQFVSGEKWEKISRQTILETKISDTQEEGQPEIIREVITEKTKEIDRVKLVKKWRFIWGRYDGDDAEEKKDLKEARDNHFSGGTVYSLNWIPIGGFVRIKGEDRESQEADSFAVKPAWTRIKVLAAGVGMNFLFAWIILSLVFWMGIPEAVDPENDSSQGKIQISEVAANSPAENNGLKIGDEIAGIQDGLEFKSVKNVQDYINAGKGREISLKIIRGKELKEFKVVPRTESLENEGALGVELVQTMAVRYPWYKAVWKGMLAVLDLTSRIFWGILGMLKNLILGAGVKIEVAGPVGIVFLTKQVASLGMIYVLQFAAILSINLGIINALPVPALDGGRVLFILIEKIRRRPVSQRLEQIFHTAGFAFLIGLMILITFRDIMKFF
ncbi:MAG: RIP metalloprotease RseP [Candidatus Moranbacteria bacterium CG06_land_8_20_14_3_00_40_12]|nr:MAG: RIP metalloprotease RseP [Candidatus Moranbacteria bacterium CG23_combo_of_CG06-09_8_20_14_all_40_16]PIU80308.1 MAG: RIP metalloprotease RseP [Candidatus Moranbacteria bacterium CG06_land_8_20_14_3_00_40_12]